MPQCDGRHTPALAVFTTQIGFNAKPDKGLEVVASGLAVSVPRTVVMQIGGEMVVPNCPCRRDSLEARQDSKAISGSPHRADALSSL